MSNQIVDRKDLKKPDQFTESVTGIFTEFSKHTRALVIVAAVILLGGALSVVWWSHQQTLGDEANSALFLAQKATEDGLKKAQDAVKPATPAETKPGTPPAVPNKVKVDVDQQLGDAVKLYQGVITKYSGTRAAFEASFILGDLYLKNGQAPKAVEWFQKATEKAPNDFQRAIAWENLGYAFEGSGKYAEAIAAYEKSNNFGQASLKGENLLGMGRAYEALKDAAKARGVYDQIISQFPNTDYAKSAELFKAALQ